MSKPPIAPHKKTASACVAAKLFPTLCARSSGQNKNVSLAPPSVANACLMLRFAASETQPPYAAVDALTGFDASKDGDAASYLTSSNVLPLTAKGVRLSYTNGVFSRFSLHETFAADVEKNASAEANMLDESEGDRGVETINQWVSDRTMGKITNLLSGQTPDMTLVNAMCFAGTFQYPFDSKLTKKTDFGRPDKSKVKVDMMAQHQMTNIVYVDKTDQGFQACVLPFGENGAGGYSLAVVLPTERVGTQAVVKHLCENNCEALLDLTTSPVYTKLVNILLPRATITIPDEDADLVDVMRNLDLDGLFAVGGLDRICADSRPAQAEKMLHKTNFTITEMGCEMVAATAFPVYRSMSPSMTMNREFVVAIVHANRSEVLYMARVSDPTQS